jgi:hypothetical protein
MNTVTNLVGPPVRCVSCLNLCAAHIVFCTVYLRNPGVYHRVSYDD